QRAAPRQKVYVVKYADDFVISGSSKEVLEERVKPAVAAFLREAEHKGRDLSRSKARWVTGSLSGLSKA
ncbi:hypothetical protein C5470_21545, partial [Photorhabdus stackebrandtii]|nr:hypothetical protein [Photorhabdus stackebrandtii]